MAGCRDRPMNVKSLKTSVGSRISKPEQVSAVVAEMQRFRGVIEGGFCVRRVESFLPETECRYFVVDGVAHAGHRRHSRLQHGTHKSS